MATSKSNSTRGWKTTLALCAGVFLFGLSNTVEAQHFKVAYYIYAKQNKGPKDTIITFNPNNFEERIFYSRISKDKHVNAPPCFSDSKTNCASLPVSVQEDCSQAAFAAAVKDGLSVPAEAKNGQLHGQVIMRAVVTKEGVLLVEPKSIRSVSPACDNAAFMVLTGLKGQWTPAKAKGKALDCVIYATIDF